MSQQRGRTIDSAHLGGVIRARRRTQGLTLAAVARATGLSVSFLSQLENGRSNTSLRSLQVIADALATNASAMLADADGNDGTVTRADDPSLVVSHGGDREVVRVRSLVHGRRALRALEFTGRAEDDRDFRHVNDEVMYVVAGAARATLGGNVGDTGDDGTVELGPGDSLYVAAGTVHRWCGLSDETVVVFVAVADDRRVNRA